MSGTGNSTTSIGKAVVTFFGQPKRHPSEWSIFGQLFLAKTRDVGIKDMFAGRGREPGEPTADAYVEEHICD